MGKWNGGNVGKWECGNVRKWESGTVGKWEEEERGGKVERFKDSGRLAECDGRV